MGFLRAALLILCLAALGACDPTATLTPGQWSTDYRDLRQNERTFFQTDPLCCPGTGAGP